MMLRIWSGEIDREGVTAGPGMRRGRLLFATFAKERVLDLNPDASCLGNSASFGLMAWWSTNSFVYKKNTYISIPKAVQAFISLIFALVLPTTSCSSP
jgi:hypothetical protein